MRVHVRFGPIADIALLKYVVSSRGQTRRQLQRPAALPSSGMMNSNLVDRTTGKLAGF